MLVRKDLVLATPPFGAGEPLGVGERVEGRALPGDAGVVSLRLSAPGTGGFFSAVDIVVEIICYVVEHEVGGSEQSPDKVAASEYSWGSGGWALHCTSDLTNNDIGIKMRGYDLESRMPKC